MTLDEKITALRECLAREQDEDAMEHLFDLIRALKLRARVQGCWDGHRGTDGRENLTPRGHELLAFLEI